MSFPIHKNWRTNLPSFRREIIDYFSLDHTRKMYCCDSSKLSYFYYRLLPEKVNFDLNIGLDTVQSRADSPERLNKILKWIISNSHKILANQNSDRWLQPNFICHLALLSKVAKTPFDNEAWIIYAAKWKGNIYLCLFETEQEKGYRANQTEKDRQMTYWGAKFEQYMTSNSPDQLPDTSKAINEAEEFDCVLQSQLSNHFLLYTVEIDAILSDEKLGDPLPLHKLKYIELKTGKLPESSKEEKRLINYKFLRWWTKSYFAGAERIICGFRDNNGIVKELKDYKVSSIVKDYKPFWHGSKTINFCNEFLNHIKKHVVHDYNHTMYKFERIPSKKDILFTTESLSSENNLLPDWYINHKPVEKSKSVKRSPPVEESTSAKKIKSK